MKLKHAIFYSLVLVMSLGSNRWANATLAGTAATIDTDRQALKAVHRATTPHTGYTVQEIASDAVAVREYLSISGVVFAVSWAGNVQPDLTQLFGSYWAEYSAAEQKVAREFGHRRRHVATNNIVVETWGHMRNLRGLAYVPSLVPPGVSIGKIQQSETATRIP